MGRYLSRALRGAGKALERGVESADTLIDGPVAGGIKQAANSSKQAVNKVAGGLADRTTTNTENDISDQSDEKLMTNDDNVVATPTSSVPRPVTDDVFLGLSVNQEKLTEMFDRSVLAKGELLKAAIWGSIESSRVPLGGSRSKSMNVQLGTKVLGLDKRSGLIGLTNQRVIFYMPKMMNRYEFESYKLKQVDTVQFTKGMRKGRIEINTAQSNRVIKGVDNDECRIIVNFIQQAMERTNEQRSAPTVVVDAQDPIKALKMKFVNGEISQEEYEMKKSILEE